MAVLERSTLVVLPGRMVVVLPWRMVEASIVLVEVAA